MPTTVTLTGLYTLSTIGYDTFVFHAAGTVRIGVYGGGAAMFAGTTARGRGGVGGADYCERTSYAVSNGTTLYALVGDNSGGDTAVSAVASAAFDISTESVSTLIVAAYYGNANTNATGAIGGAAQTTDATTDYGGPLAADVVHHGGKGGNGATTGTAGGGGGGGAGGPTAGATGGGNGLTSTPFTGGTAGTGGASDGVFPAAGNGAAGGTGSASANAGTRGTSGNAPGGGEGGNGSNAPTSTPPTGSTGKVCIYFTAAASGSDRRNILAAA